MPFYSTMAETEIECSALAAYHYITNPANWRDIRPVSDPGWTVVPAQGQVTKEAWTQRQESEAPVTRGWTVLEAEPGRRWIVRSSGFGSGSSITVTYSLAEREGMTHFLRHMEIEVPDHAAVSEHARAAFTCSRSSHDLIAAIKQTLERASQVVMGTGAMPVQTPQPR
ncbi:hypothetical protein GCM10009854_31200 [Saccharopolyspora halophila]|uniref:Uncharacterized protein n=2 Tax=Saccharopolyspora halophila TaxID=405551 RepID=A0ABP5TF29_9PSEU